MTTIDDILAAAQALPSEDRAKLIAFLWDGVSSEDWVPPTPEWIAECERRSKALEAGEMSFDSWENVRARARRKAGLDD
ncbi:MAG: addiction module protein [Planctomycetales bacterium]|nr:addiction module protein [Planctomycetales bacterium]